MHGSKKITINKTFPLSHLLNKYSSAPSQYDLIVFQDLQKTEIKSKLRETIKTNVFYVKELPQPF